MNRDAILLFSFPLMLAFPLLIGFLISKWRDKQADKEEANQKQVMV